MPVAHDADPWVRPPLGGNENSWSYGVDRDGPGPQADLSFADLIDIINPLQHIPLVSSLYRELTGDQIQPAAQIMGATLYGGPIGFVAATNLTVLQEVAGNSPPDLMVAALIGSDEPEGLENIAQIDATLAESMPLPTSGEAPRLPSAESERERWPWTRRSERDPPVQAVGWTQNWQSQPRDAAPNTAPRTVIPAAAAQTAAARKEGSGLGNATASQESGPDKEAGLGDRTPEQPPSFLPFPRVKYGTYGMRRQLVSNRI